MKSVKIALSALALVSSLSAVSAKEAYSEHFGDATTVYESTNTGRSIAVADHTKADDLIAAPSHVGANPRSPEGPVNFEN